MTIVDCDVDPGDSFAGGVARVDGFTLLAGGAGLVGEAAVVVPHRTWVTVAPVSREVPRVQVPQALQRSRWYLPSEV
jgi:hypothetical protein